MMERYLEFCKFGPSVRVYFILESSFAALFLFYAQPRADEICRWCGACGVRAEKKYSLPD